MNIEHQTSNIQYKTGHLNPRVNPVKVFTAGRAWRRAGRYGALIGRDPGIDNSLASAIKSCPEKVDHVKIVNSGLNSLVQFGKETLPQFSLEEMTAAVTMQAYIAYMQKTVSRKALPHTGKDALHPVEGARRNLEHQLEQMAMARQLGVPVAAGTDAGSPGVDHGKSLKEEIGLLIQAGYSISEAMKSATRINAQLLGLDNTGLLADRAAATFVAIEGPPEDIPNSLNRIKGLYIDGKPFM